MWVSLLTFYTIALHSTLANIVSKEIITFCKNNGHQFLSLNLHNELIAGKFYKYGTCYILSLSINNGKL